MKPITALLTLGLALGALAAAMPAQASIFGRKPAATADGHAASAAVDKAVAQIQKALDEQRLMDAARGLDQASLAGLKDPRLSLLAGDLSLARGQPDLALDQYKQAEKDAGARGHALQGEGIVLSSTGHSEEALQVLQKAVTEDPTAWRAWNALGAEYDERRDWTDAETAYDHALSNSDGAAIVMNNRGYSRLLQNRLDEAVADFVEALRKKPDLAAARNNIRLAMAMRGQYDRALAGGAPEDKAALLNNAGFAAILRGDYAKAQDLLDQAMKARGEYYARASANLDVARDLTARAPSAAASPAPAPASDTHEHP
ncbi:tetratricopeptide repeat protein [Caulobacter sp. KR2-114]|uniref:tetratricopeptide repeat protein n=1 Tax=Caulobacter sp. KR2-114 TaxID=3400912 RepID=UPI003BFD8BFB